MRVSRREQRNVSYLIAVLLIGLASLLFFNPDWSSPKKITNTSVLTQSIKSLQINPQNYEGEETTIKGMHFATLQNLAHTTNVEGLRDDQGYKVLFVPTVDRVFIPGNKYSVTGVFKRGKTRKLYKTHESREIWYIEEK